MLALAYYACMSNDMPLKYFACKFLCAFKDVAGLGLQIKVLLNRGANGSAQR